MLYAVIMAGGAGTRLWPLSRRRQPKQTIPIAGGASLFQRAIERMKGLVAPERTLVITNADLVGLLRSQAPGIPAGNIIGEPFGRDSAPAVFLAAAIIAHRDKNAVFLVAPADHLIAPRAKFQAAARKAARIAAKEKVLVTFGIRPEYPATVYGYIERGEKMRGAGGAFQVRRFHEKPGVATARRYVKDGRYYWNSGMFVWRAETILAAARKYSSEHARAIEPLGALFGTREFAAALKKAYAGMKKTSVDYAVMEKATNVVMVEADFEWSDVGSPAAMRKYARGDKAGNVRQGLTELHESTGCITVSDDEHLLAVFGCDNMVVIHTADATLVCPAERAEEIKALIAVIERREELKKFL